MFVINKGSWSDIEKIEVENKSLIFNINGQKNYLKDENQFIGFNGENSSPNSILLKNNNLHFDIIINPNSPIGRMIKLIFLTL